MGRIRPFRWGLALAVVLVAQQTFAGEVCRSGCRGAGKTFKYAQGTTYKYDYEGKIDISVSSAEGQVSTTEVKATVLLTQQADCNQLLRLQNVHIIGANGKKYGNIPDLEKPISINFHDGHIEDSICTVTGDTQNSLNIKRAIASLFQANLKGSHETDVFGLCPTDIARHNEGQYLVIQKSRNLNKCAYRENIRQDFLSTVFNVHSEIKSSPILNGEYSAKLKIKNGILDQVNTIENYLYVPFSVGKNGAKAQVTSKLHLIGTSKENPQSQCTQPKSIIFDNPHPTTAPTCNVNSILEAVKAVVKTIDIVVGEETAKEFVTLVKTIRAAKKEDLLAAYNQVKSGAGFSDKITAKKAFLDALLQAATSDAVEVAITLLKSNEFNDVEKKLVYVSLSFVRHSSESLLTTAASLLDQRNLPYEVYLGIGNIAGRFCKRHNCDNVDAVNTLTQKLIQKLGDNKAANKQEENEMVYVLKSLANFGHLSDSVIQKLVSVTQDKNAPTRLRVIALETYLADPCEDKLRNSALEILSDIQQDSEIRIKAYLAATECPNAKVGKTIKTLLDKEPSYQVGGFIVSHIRNVKASANPDKNLAKQFLSFSVPKRFPIDFRKYSYNGEFSYAINTLGLAASSESNVIYSQDSFLPRSASLNLTAEVFGHTFNFLELQTRQENLDRLIEHYFGPKGILKTSSLSNILKENSNVTMESLNYLNKKYNEVIRNRRDISKAEIESIGKAVQIKDNALNKDLDLDLSVKAFGSEVFFNNFNIYQGGFSPEAIIDKVMKNFAEGLDKLKNFKETLRSNLLLLDVELDYPTSLGFPLRLAAEGSANIQIQTEGNIDIRELVKSYSCDTKLKLIPSANVEITGRLTLDAHVIENGLKIINTLHSATGIDLSVDLSKSQEFDIKLGLPLQEEKIITANHDIVFHSREQAGQETNTPLKFAQQKDFSICIDQLSPFIGLAFCGEINGPDLVGKQTPVLPFPLSGFAKVGVSIEKEDLSYYQLKGSLNKKGLGADLAFTSFGKNNEKKTELNFNLELTPEHYVKLVLTSPLKTAYAEGRLTDTPNEKSALAKFGYDQQEFYGKIGIAISGPSNKLVYKPIFEYKLPEGIQGLPVKVEGQIVAEESANGKKYILDHVKLCLPNGQDVSVNGNFGAENDAFFTDLSLSTGQASGTFKGRLIYQPHLVKFNSEFTNSINPAFNFDIKSEVKSSSDSKSKELSFQLIHGSDLSSKTNKLLIEHKREYYWKGAGDFRFTEEGKLSYPLLGVNAEFEVKTGPKSVEFEVDLQYNEIKLGTELDVTLNKEHAGDFDIKFGIHGLDNKVEVKLEREVHGDTSKIENELEVNGKKLEVKGDIKHVLKSGSVDIGADLTVVIPSHSTPFKIKSGLKYNPNDYDIHHKVTSGSTVVVDAFIKGNKQGNANGSFKVNIKNYLVANGQVKATKGAGTADLLIDAQRVKQHIKLESAFKIQPPSVYDFDLTIYPSFDKDKNQQIKISSHNKVEPTSLDSKSSLDVLGKKIEFNLQGKKTGNEQTGNLNGEVELTLPNDVYLLGKVNSNREHKNEIFNGDEILSLEYRKNKNTSGKKLSVKAVYKNTNPVQGLYDVAYTLSADDSNGANINGDLYFKRQKQGHQFAVEIGNKIYGSMIKNALSGNLKAIYEENKAQLDIVTSYGADTNVQIGGSYGCPGTGKPYTGDVYLKLSSPSKVLKTLNAELSGSILKPENPSEHLEIKGSGKIFADDDGSVPEPIIDFKGEGALKACDKDGNVEGKINYGKQEPISASAGYSLKEKGKEKQLNGDAAFSYGQGKNFKFTGSLVSANENQVKIDAQIETPFEKYQKTKFHLQSQRSPDQKHITGKLQVDTDGKKLALDSELQLSDISPLVDLKFKSFDGKSSQIYFKANTITEKEFNGELKLSCEPADFLFESNLNANFDNIQNFFLKAAVNSPTLKINKISIEAQNKPGKGDRKIQITVKQADKNLVTGTTSYQIHDEQGKFLVEGSGTFKVKGESRSGNFKYISQRLGGEKNGEEGIDVSLDVNIGKTTLDAELKLTNKQFKLLNSYCQKPKECSRIEINSDIKSNDIKLYDQVIEVVIDLRKLGVPQDFSLKAATQRKESNLDHHVDIQFNNGATKYQYDVYVHPTKAGISLATPQREISLEANVNIPNDIKKGGKFSGDICFYLDKKNAPNKKASIEGWLDVDVSNLYKINGEAKLHHPGLPRVLTISLNSLSEYTNSQQQITITTEFDVFAQPQQKIVSLYKASATVSSEGLNSAANLDVKSSGLGINIEWSENAKLNRNTYSGEYNNKLKYHVGNSKYDNVLSGSASKEQLNLLLKVLNTDLIKVSSKLSISKDQQVIDSEICSYDNSPVLAHLDIKNLNTLLFTIGYKNNPKEKLQVSAGLIPGQIADVRGDRVKGSGKTNLFHATVHLDETNFLKPDFNINSKEIEDLIRLIEHSSTIYLDGLKKLGKDWADIDTKELAHLTEILKALPNPGSIKQYYASELEKIKSEFLEDKSIKELLEVLNNTFGAAFKSLLEITDELTKYFNAIVHSLQVTISGVVETIEKDVIPPIKELTDKLAVVFSDITKSALEIVSAYLATISQLIEKYQPQFKELAALFGEVGQDIARFIQNAYLQTAEIILGLGDKLYHELRALPIVEELKAQFEEFTRELVPTIDGVIGGLTEISATLKDLIPPEFIAKPEIVEIIDLTIEYIGKKLKQEPVNDILVLEKILADQFAIFRKILSLLSTASYEPPSGDIPFTLDFLKNLPKLVAVKFSPIAYILKEDPTDAIVSFITSLVDNPRKWVPPFPLHGILIQGRYIFSFDGKLITFPGNCKYLLARDAVNGNFTLAGTYNNGYLNSITLADHHDSITIKKGGQVLLNNAPTELPARKSELAAFRNYEMINLVSTSGISVSCLPDLDGCAIAISGFYHGQVRGLLGNGNNEPYDDLTTATGKIVTKEDDFGNSYKIGDGPVVTAPKHAKTPENAKCNQLFGWESSLRLCYPFVSTDNFKAACAQGMTSKVKHIELLVAKAYVAACWEHSIPVAVPSNLLKCTNADQLFDVGETFSVKTPGKSADIVLIVDTVKENEELYKDLVQPAVVEIVKLLKDKGVTDVQFHLIGYGGENQWPSHVTVGGKLTFKNKAPKIKFSSEPEDSLRGLEYLPGLYKGYIALFEDILYDLKLAVGQDLRAQTFTEAYFYPFRANALKSIIVANSKPCEVGRFFLLQKLRTILFRNTQISLNLITPLEKLKLKDNKNTKDVIGFNDHQVFTISQTKKKEGGSAELYKDLDYEDFCVDFTIKNRGNVFGTNNFASANANVKKQFVHVAAQNIVNELLKVEQGLDCKCRQVSPYNAYNVCEESYSKEKN